MIALFALLALLGAASAEIDLSDRNDITVDASVYLHVEVDQLFYRKPTRRTKKKKRKIRFFFFFLSLFVGFCSNVALLMFRFFTGKPNSTSSTASDRLVLQFSKVGLRLPIKDNVQDEKASLTNLAKPYFFMASTCLGSNWNATGTAALPKSHVVVDEQDTYIYQWIDYADSIMYSDFERPFFEFQVDAFVQANQSTSCLPGSNDQVTRQNFTERLCYTEDSFCNVWVGQSGWLYFGPSGNTSTTADYGIHVQPRWNWTGSRELFELNETNFLDVRAVDSSSDVYAASQAMLSRSVSIPFEFNDCKVKEDGVLLFHVDSNGYLERQLSCNSLEMSDYSSVVFDFANKFDESKLVDIKLPGENRWNFTFNIIRVKYASPYDVKIDPAVVGQEPYVELNRLPDDYFLSGIDWFTTITYNSGKFDIIKTWFTVEKAEGTTTTTAATTRPPTVATQPPPMCPKDCNGHGVCSTGNTCQCDVAFKADSVEGCIAIMEDTTTGVTSSIATLQTQPLSGTTVVTEVRTTEPTRTKDPNLASGTFTGTKAPTNPPIGQVTTTTAGLSTTAGVAQVVLSAGAVMLGALAFAF